MQVEALSRSKTTSDQENGLALRHAAQAATKGSERPEPDEMKLILAKGFKCLGPAVLCLVRGQAKSLSPQEEVYCGDSRDLRRSVAGAPSHRSAFKDESARSRGMKAGLEPL